MKEMSVENGAGKSNEMTLGWRMFVPSRQQQSNLPEDRMIPNIVLILSEQDPRLHFYILDAGLVGAAFSDSGMSCI